MSTINRGMLARRNSYAKLVTKLSQNPDSERVSEDVTCGVIRIKSEVLSIWMMVYNFLTVVSCIKPFLEPIIP